MKKTFKFFSFLVVVLLIGAVVGYQQFILAPYTYTGDGKTISDVFHGNVSFTGSGNKLTIQAGSQVDSITLLGNDNRVRIEAGAHVGQIRGIGSGNTISAPQEMEIDLSLLKGDNNGRAQSGARSLDGL